jgi:hypothetical protein
MVKIGFGSVIQEFSAIGERINASINKASGLTAVVGFNDTEVHEYAPIVDSSRPFFDKSIKQGNGKIMNTIADEFAMVIDGKQEVETALEHLGAVGAELVRSEIRRQDLIDTGRMLASVASEVH